MKTINASYNINIDYNENQGIWTVTVNGRSQTVYSLDDVLHKVNVYQSGLTNLIK